MYLKIKSQILKLFSGSERTQIVKKNIVGSFVIKGFGIGTSLLLVPFTIDLLNQEKYGIWMTIFSIITWFNMMDVGLGNGFRNKFTAAVANKNTTLGKDYVQTLYSSMALIGGLFSVIFLLLNPYLNWYSILNLNDKFDENLSIIVSTIFILFCIQLYTKNISTVFLALQKTTLSNSLGLYANILSLILIYVLQQLNFISLFSIAIAFMISPIVVNIYSTIKYFAGEGIIYKPKLISLPKKEHLNDLMGLGIKFFFIQITTIVMFSAGNIIISQLFNPAQVTPYDVAFRFYSSIQGVFFIVITPFWSAFTEANARKDFEWIRRAIKKLLIVWAVFSVGVIVLWILSPFIFELWVGKSVVIPSMLSLQFAFFVIIITWTNLFVFYINGVGKIRLQLIIAMIQLIFNIPLAILLAKNLNLGLSGVIMATNISLLLPAILIPIQYKKLITQKAYGIWSK
jgi:O-antigen/teichoic acid export membrane protein